jgi:hypothetical protein
MPFVPGGSEVHWPREFSPIRLLIPPEAAKLPRRPLLWRVECVYLLLLCENIEIASFFVKDLRPHV